MSSAWLMWPPQAAARPVVLGALVVAAQNEVHAAAVGGQRLQRGVHVGRLGIVHVGHAGHDADHLQAVRHAGEAAQRGRDSGGGHAAGAGRRGRGQRVAAGCGRPSGQARRRRHSSRARAPAPSASRSSQSTPCPSTPATSAAPLGTRVAAGPAENQPAPAPPAHAPRRHLGDRAGIVAVEQRQLARLLVLEHAQLGGHVGPVAAVAVHVVLGEVQQHAPRAARKRSMCSSWKLDSSATTTASARDLAPGMAARA